jgi:hypothetical protein
LLELAKLPYALPAYPYETDEPVQNSTDCQPADQRLQFAHCEIYFRTYTEWKDVRTNDFRGEYVYITDLDSNVIPTMKMDNEFDSCSVKVPKERQSSV